MKILIVSNKFPPNAHGGYEISAGVVAKALVAQGHEVVVATAQHALGEWKELPEARVHFTFQPILWYDITEIAYARQSSRRRRELYHSFAGSVIDNDRELRRLIIAEHPDIIWVFNIMRIGPLGIMHTCLSSGVPTIFHFQDHLDQEIHEFAANALVLESLRLLKTQAFALFCSKCCSEYNSLLGTYAASRTLPTYGPNPFSPAPAYHAYTPSEPLRVVHMGNLCHYKGTDITVEGFVDTVHQFPGRAHLQLAGGGDELFIKKVREKHHPNVELLGPVELSKLLELLTHCHVAILPTRPDEPFGLVIYEAIRAGCLCMIGSNAGATDALEPYHNYIPLYTRTAGEIARQLECVLQSPQTYRTMTENAWNSDWMATPEEFVQTVLALKPLIPVPAPPAMERAESLIKSLATAPADRPTRFAEY